MRSSGVAVLTLAVAGCLTMPALYLGGQDHPVPEQKLNVWLSLLAIAFGLYLVIRTSRRK